MSDRWHKQVAVRFPPNDLEALDRLVKAGVGRNKRAWYSWGPWTRSGVLLALVREADAKLREQEAEEAARKKKPTKKAKTGGRK